MPLAQAPQARNSRNLYRFVQTSTELVSENTNGTRVFDLFWDTYGFTRESHTNMPKYLRAVYTTVTDVSAEGHERCAAVEAMKCALGTAMGWDNYRDTRLMFHAGGIEVFAPPSGHHDVGPVRRFLRPVSYGDTVDRATVDLKLIARYVHKDSPLQKVHERDFKLVYDPKDKSDRTDEKYWKTIAYVTDCPFPSFSNVCHERYFPLRMSAGVYSYVLQHFHDMKCVFTESLIQETKTFIANATGWDSKSIGLRLGRGRCVIVVTPPKPPPAPMYTSAADGIDTERWYEVWALVLVKDAPGHEGVGLLRLRFAKKLASAVAVNTADAAGPAVGPLVGGKRGRETAPPIAGASGAASAAKLAAGAAGGAGEKKKKSADAKTGEEAAVGKVATDVAEGYNSDLSDCDWHICDPDCACRGGSDNGN